MKVVERRLSELHPMQKNIRRHNEKQIAEYIRSLEMFGQTRPIALDEADVILIGNGMYEALKRMGRETAWCIEYKDLPESKKLKMMIADNRLYELGMTDMRVFEEIVHDLGDDIDVPGWDEDILETLQASMADADEMISSYGTFAQEEVERVSDRRREDHAAYVPPISTGEPLQRPSAPTQEAGQVPHSYAAPPPSTATGSPEERFIICPHCGERIPVTFQMGGD